MAGGEVIDLGGGCENEGVCLGGDVAEGLDDGEGDTLRLDELCWTGGGHGMADGSAERSGCFGWWR